MPRNLFQRTIFALLTVIVTVHAYVFFSLYVLHGDLFMQLTGESSVIAAINAMGGVYMLGRNLPIWALVLIEFVLAFSLEITMGSPCSCKLASKVFNPKDYRLYTINEGTMTDQYSEFVYDRFGSDYRNMDSDHIRNSVAAFNHEQRVADLLNVDEAIKEDCYAQYVESKSTPEGMVKTIRKVTKKVISE